MNGLLEKDFRLISKRLTYFVMLAGIIIFLGFSAEASFIAAYVPILAAICSITTISYDEFDNGMAYLFTLPVKARDYAIEKYIFGLILGLVGSAFSILIVLIIGKIKNEAVDIETMLLILPVFLTMMGIMFPIELKFGAEKSRIAMYIVFGSVVGLGILGKKIIETMNIDLTPILTKINSMPDALVAASIVLINVIIFVVSLFISIKIMEKKEY
ncbi:MAG: ABC-2 transporter permease [Clostridia bacterium]|nr:ABC-2 transporter permease [Clostridia bacterium]